MEPYNPSKVYYYSIDELVVYVLSKEVTIDDLYKVWKFKKDHPKLERALDAKDNEDWGAAEKTNTSESYQAYLKVFDNEPPFYRGAHVEEAKAALTNFESQHEEVVEADEVETAESTENDETKEDSKNVNLDNHSEEVDGDTSGETANNETSETSEASEEQLQDSQEESHSTDEIHDNIKDVELQENDNREWLKATAADTLSAYSEYLNKYSDTSNGYQGKHVEAAKQRILQIEETNAWNKAKATGTVKAYEDYLAKYEPQKNVLKVSHIEEAKQAISKIKHPKPVKFLKLLLSVVGVCVLGLIGYWIIDLIKKANQPIPLSDAEVAEIIKEVQDSLKVELFDGFYVLPASNYQGEGACQVDDNSNLFSREEVVNEYVRNHSSKRLNVYNKNGDYIGLPESTAGIDSICLTQAPFLEFIDNNGLKRVVALFHDDVYYYLGDCGSHDGFRQYILANKDGKSGLVDVNGTVLKDFVNESISVNANGYCIKNGGTKQYYNFLGNGIEPESPKAETTSDSKNHLPTLYNFCDSNSKLWGYKDGKGNVVIPPRYKSCSSQFRDLIEDVRLPNGKCAFIDRKGNTIAVFKTIYGSIVHDGNYVVKGDNDKYGLYNANRRSLTLPLNYDEVLLCGEKMNLFPVKINGLWGYAHKGGSMAISPKFNDVRPFNSETKFAAAKDKNDKWGYIDTYGDFKIKPQYYSAETMYPHGARVMKSPNHYGFITLSGSLIASWYYRIGGRYYDDRIWVQNQEGLKGFVDRNNRLVIPYLFEGEYDLTFKEQGHLANVKYKGVWWYINPNGAFCYPADSNLLPNNQDIQLQIKEAEKKAQEEAETKAKGKADKENKKGRDSDRKQSSKSSNR